MGINPMFDGKMKTGGALVYEDAGREDCPDAVCLLRDELSGLL